MRFLLSLVLIIGLFGCVHPSQQYSSARRDSSMATSEPAAVRPHPWDAAIIKRQGLQAQLAEREPEVLEALAAVKVTPGGVFFTKSRLRDVAGGTVPGLSKVTVTGVGLSLPQFEE